MARFFLLVLFAGLLSVLTACDQHGRRQTGMTVRAAESTTPDQLGGTTEAILSDEAVGGVPHYIVGNLMEKDDRIRLNRILETTPSYETGSWSNPDTGSRFLATPRPAYEDPKSRLACRNITIIAELDGRTEQTEATACRQEGRWEVR